MNEKNQEMERRKSSIGWHKNSSSVLILLLDTLD